MKLFFLIAAVVLLAAVMLLEKTKNTPSQFGTTCLIWATDDNPMRQEQMALFQNWYQTKYGAAIDIRIDPSNFDSSKIVIQSVAGSGPDIFDYFGATELRAFVESGIILDVTETAQKEAFGVQRFWPVLNNSLVFKGRQYGAPDNTILRLILINEAMLAEKGLSKPLPGWTWSDLVTLAQKLTESGADGRRTCYGLLNIQWSDLILQNGAQFFSATGTRSVLNNPQTIEALNFYQDLRSKYRVTPSNAERASMSGQGGYGAGDLNLYINGQGAMMEFGRYGYIAIHRINQERVAQGLPPRSFVPLPPLTGKKSMVVTAARCTGINRRSAHQVEATRFLEFLASREFNDQIDRDRDGIATIPEYAFGPTGIAGGRPTEAGCDDSIWIDALNQSVPAPSSPYLNGAVQDRILNEEMSRFNNGLQDAAETARRMEDRLNSAISDYIRIRPEALREWRTSEMGSAL